jgi:predicted O-methyltransferase YrrM
MYKPVPLALKYLQYLLKADNGKGHGIHSPFVYDFVRQVLLDRRDHPAYMAPEQYRAALLKDHTLLQLDDLGAGSRKNKSAGRRVSAIAGTSVKPKRYARLLYRIAAHYMHRKIIELGTSLGVTTHYLAGVPGVEKLVTLEGARQVADYAERHFRDAGLSCVELVKGNFDATLGKALVDLGGVDMAFIDGNHRREPTIKYFNMILEKCHPGSCIVLDDIHWSREMEEAWDDIRRDGRVRLSIDLFSMGMVFLHPDFREKQDFMIRF